MPASTVDQLLVLGYSRPCACAGAVAVAFPPAGALPPGATFIPVPGAMGLPRGPPRGRFPAGMPHMGGPMHMRPRGPGRGFGFNGGEGHASFD